MTTVRSDNDSCSNTMAAFLDRFYPTCSVRGTFFVKSDGHGISDVVRNVRVSGGA